MRNINTHLSIFFLISGSLRAEQKAFRRTAYIWHLCYLYRYTPSIFMISSTFWIIMFIYFEHIECITLFLRNTHVYCFFKPSIWRRPVRFQNRPVYYLFCLRTVHLVFPWDFSIIYSFIVQVVGIMLSRMYACTAFKAVQLCIKTHLRIISRPTILAIILEDSYMWMKVDTWSDFFQAKHFRLWRGMC